MGEKQFYNITEAIAALELEINEILDQHKNWKSYRNYHDMMADFRKINTLKRKLNIMQNCVDEYGESNMLIAAGY